MVKRGQSESVTEICHESQFTISQLNDRPRLMPCPNRFVKYATCHRRPCPDWLSPWCISRENPGRLLPRASALSPSVRT